MKFLTRMVFAKNFLPATFGSHPEFLRKTQKCVYLRNGARSAVYLQSLLAFFHKNCFPTTFGGHLEFLHKAQKPVYFGNEAR